MATNKNALIRYQVLDRCFRNPGRMYFWQDLLDECNKALFEEDPESSGIQRRQLFDDIRFMQSEQGWAVPLGKYRQGRKVFYRYTDLSFSINNQPLNEAEVAQIKSAVQVISRFTGSPEFEWVDEMIPMLESKLGLIEKKGQAISFEGNVDLKGFKFITPLFNAIVNERALLIIYQDFKSTEPYEVFFHPYHLKQYNNRWFVFGLNSAKANPYWNLALDRIVKLNETDSPYQESSIDWEDYFYDIIGVTRREGEYPIEVNLLFSLDVASYVTTKPLHPSQKHKEVDNGLEVAIRVIPNYELESLILSFGEKVTVLSPKTLKDKILRRINNASSLY